MSKRICGRCGSTDIEENSLRGEVIWCNCNRCKYFAKVADFPEQSVFDKITASPEVLAEKMTYWQYDPDQTRCGWTNNVIVGQLFKNYHEAIAATVAKLKEQAQ